MNNKERIIEDAALIIERANDIILEMVNTGKPSKISVNSLNHAIEWLNDELERDEQ